MLSSATLSDRKSVHNDRSIYNGVLITHDDLSAPILSTDSGGTSTIYVKPLDSNAGTLTPDSHCDKSCPDKEHKPSVSEDFPNVGSKNTATVTNPNVIRTIQTDHRRRATGSPAANRLNRSTFNRHSSVRRSLGGIALPPSLAGEGFSNWDRTETDSPDTPNDRLAVSHSLQHTDPLSPVLRVRASRLPSFNDIGFNLEPYYHPTSNAFVGLQLLDRFRNHELHTSAKERFPFCANDVILSVNQHKLANMNMSEAIQYVCNSFRDARQYTVEFGVYRSVDLPALSAIVPADFPQSPHRGTNQNRYSTSFLPIPTQSSSADPHRPLRNRTDRSAEHQTILFTDSRSGWSYVRASDRISRDLTDALNQSSSSSTAVQSTQPPDLGASPPGSFTSGRRSLGGSIAAKRLNAFNTRTIGQKISIDLVKSVDGGLGFTLTSRDTQVGTQNNEPVYVKTILSTGAAIVDGRLQVGDRLLSVDNKEVENLEHALSQLRQVRPGSPVNLVVSRHTCALPDEQRDRPSILIDRPPEVDRPAPPHRSFTFDFPLPPSPCSVAPCLGVNFKWAVRPNEADESYADCPGLYVDSLMSLGLISEVGRQTLLPGDRLVGLNGESLEGLGAKAISSRIKAILLGNTPADLSVAPRRRNFSLTVHRYSQASYQRPTRTTTTTDHLMDSTKLQYRRIPTRQASLEKHWGGGRPQLLSPTGNDRERYCSVPSRESAVAAFNREGFGRRSVSEKRHGHIDPTRYSFFQTNILPNRCRMPEDVDKQYSTMPTARRLKLHKERLSTAGPSGPLKAFDVLAQPSDDQPSCYNSEQLSRTHTDREENLNSQGSFLRGKKQNTSFRSAVDRSLISYTPTTTQTNHAPPDLDPISSSSRLVSTGTTSLAVQKARNSSSERAETPVPAIPPRHQPANSNKTKRKLFGSFKGLFKRTDKASSQCEHSSSTSSTSAPPPVSTNNRSVPVTPSSECLPIHKSTSAGHGPLDQQAFNPNDQSNYIPPKMDKKRSNLSGGHICPASSDKRGRFRPSGELSPPPPLPPRSHSGQSQPLKPKSSLPASSPVFRSRPSAPVKASSGPSKNSSRVHSPVYIPKSVIRNQTFSYQSLDSHSLSNGVPRPIDQRRTRTNFHYEPNTKSVQGFRHASTTATTRTTQRHSEHQEQSRIYSTKQLTPTPYKRQPGHIQINPSAIPIQSRSASIEPRPLMINPTRSVPKRVSEGVSVPQTRVPKPPAKLSSPASPNIANSPYHNHERKAKARHPRL